MATTHLSFNDQSDHGRILRRALNNLEEGLENLNDVIATMATMRDGDGTLAAHWTYATAKFGFSSDANTLAAWNELNSVAFKLNTNASITDMNAAMVQVFNKFR